MCPNDVVTKKSREGRYWCQLRDNFACFSIKKQVVGSLLKCLGLGDLFEVL